MKKENGKKFLKNLKSKINKIRNIFVTNFITILRLV